MNTQKKNRIKLTKRIVESLGATEGAPAAGTAEVIVDITSTGSTLTANQRVPSSEPGVRCVIKSTAEAMLSSTELMGE